MPSEVQGSAQSSAHDARERDRVGSLHDGRLQDFHAHSLQLSGHACINTDVPSGGGSRSSGQRVTLVVPAVS